MSAGLAGATAPQQFYVTHCARTDSVFNTVGFSVRAASSTDPNLLKVAMEYPAYELPMELWAKKPGRSDAPRRLARVKVPGGAMVVHTGYLEKDTMNRDRSFFTHILLLPTATAADVLKSWNSHEWTTDYAPGEDKSIGAPSTELPSGPAVSDAALKQFLTARELGPCGGLATAVWSDKLKGDLAARKALVARAVQGVLLANANPNRNRLYIHAEPGLVALLIYAAARLLPHAISDDLTFTTFEPAHRGLREYKRALIVGTYLAAPAKGLDAELVNARAYVVDAINPERGSRELLGETPTGIARLVELAATANRHSIRAIHTLCDSDKLTIPDLERAVILSGALERLEAKNYQADDLIALQKDVRGRKAVAALETDLWPRVRDLAVNENRKDVLDAFRPWFATTPHLDDVMAAGFTSLSKGSVPGWDARWRVLRDVLANPAHLGAALDRTLTARAGEIPRLAPAGRKLLRTSLGAATGVGPAALAPLLTPGTVAELEELLADRTLLAEYRAFAAVAARISSSAALHQRVAAHLAAADPDALGEYARQVGKDHPELADELFDIDAQGNAPNLDRLLNTGSTYVKADWWMWAANRVPLFKDDAWWSVLVSKQRLGKFLRAVGGDPAGLRAWDWTLALVDAHFLDEGMAAQAVWAELDRAATLIQNDGGDPSAVVPARAYKRLAAGRLLLSLLGGKESIPPAAEIRDAFEEFGLTEELGLWAVFDKTCRKTTPETNSKAYARMAEVFGSILPASETSYSPNKRALNVWLAFASKCPEGHQAEIQAFYFANPHLAPESPKQRLEQLDEVRKYPLDSRVAADVRMLANRAQTTSAQTRHASQGKQKSRWRLFAVLGAVLVALVVGFAMWPKSGEPEVADAGKERKGGEKKDAEKKGGEGKKMADKATADKKAIDDKNAADKIAAEKKAIDDKNAADKIAAEKKAVDDKNAADKIAADKIAEAAKIAAAMKKPEEVVKDKFEQWEKTAVPSGGEKKYLDDFMVDFVENQLKEHEKNEMIKIQVRKYAIQGRQNIILALSKRLAENYDKEMKESSLPLIGDKILKDFQPLKEMHSEINSLHNVAPKEVQDDATIKQLMEKIAIDEKDWSARKKLAELFKPTPFKASVKEAKDFFVQVNEEYLKLRKEPTKAAERTHEAVRSKVQQYCNEFMTPKLALDEYLILDGALRLRSDLKVQYEKSTEPLTKNDPEGLNERTAMKDKRMFKSFLIGKNPVGSKLVAPTHKSDAAFDYLEVRTKVAKNGGWTRDDLASLQKVFIQHPGDETWNKLMPFDNKGDFKVGDYRVFDRWVAVRDTINNHGYLFSKPKPKVDPKTSPPPSIINPMPKTEAKPPTTEPKADPKK